jgi:hypothetical protein
MVNKLTKIKSKIIWISISVTGSIVIAVFAGSGPVLACLKGTFAIIIAILFGSVLMALMEYYALWRKISYFSRPLVRFGRLPETICPAFAVAFFSRSAANVMLVNNYQETDINRKEMIIGALAFSYPSMIISYFQLMFPVIAAIGAAGIIYFSIMNLIGILVTALILLYARFSLSEPVKNESPQLAEPIEERLPLKVVMKNFRARVFMLVSRALLITVPLYMLTSMATEKGWFKMLQANFPDGIRNFLSPEIMTVAFARMGSIFAAAGTASELMSRSQLNLWTVVFAFLLGNLLSMPIRFFRRTIPANVSIFSGYDGLIIALSGQLLRMLFVILALLLLLPFIKG